MPTKMCDLGAAALAPTQPRPFDAKPGARVVVFARADRLTPFHHLRKIRESNFEIAGRQ